MDKVLIDRFQKMIDVNSPIILIPDHDFWRIDELIWEANNGKHEIWEWNPTEHWLKWKALPTPMNTSEDAQFPVMNKVPMTSIGSLIDQLKMFYSEEPDASNRFHNRIVVLKNLHDMLRPEVVSTEQTELVSTLQLIAQDRLYCEDVNTTIVFVDPCLSIPESLKKYISILEIPFPSDEQITELINLHLSANSFDTAKANVEKLRPNLKGLTRFEIDRILDIAMSSNGSLSAEDNQRILREKKAMVKKEGILEIIDAPTTIDDIGGLEVLKTYLKEKSVIVKHFGEAQARGVEAPKGIFLVGMPGCGKSLCAKAAAALFETPLLKLDMGSMMGKYVGESEGNLRKALRIAEAAAPCILWIDEIEKAFSGVKNGGNDVLMRMFGHFLSWMQEKDSMVYVIATANNVKSLPPELKRKGRFDEIFFVDLPNKDEIEKIFAIHLNKGIRKNCPKASDLNISQLKASGYFDKLQKKGYNGADIEAIIKEAIEKLFIRQHTSNVETLQLTKKDIDDVIEKTKSISESCKADIDEMKKLFKESDFTKASA